MVAHLILSLASLVLLTSAGSPAVLELSDRDIRLHDLALARAGEANTVLGRVPQGTNRVEVDEEAARRLISNRLPLAEAKLAFEGSLILVAPSPVIERRNGHCFVAISAIAKDEFLDASLVEKAPCESSDTQAIVGYDRDASAPVALSDIAPGTNLGPIRPLAEKHIAKGANVQLVTGAGPVTISRSATTVQVAREGRNVFIRTSDGEVFPAPVSHIVEEKAQ